MRGWGHACACGWCRCTDAGVCLGACSLTNPPCNAPPYCHLRLLWLHHISRHYLVTGTIFGNKSLGIKCVFWFSLQLLFETFPILRRIWRDIVINERRLHVKYLLFLSDFKKTWIFSPDFRKQARISSFIKIRLVEAELFHADGRTDRQIWQS